MAVNDRIRTKQFNPDVLQREILSRTDVGYRKLLDRDSALLPLPHERPPAPTIFKYDEPAPVMSVGSHILDGQNYIFELKRVSNWLKGFLSPMFGPGKMSKLIKTEGGLVLKTSNLRLATQHVAVKHPICEIILGCGLSMSKLFGDHSIYTSLLATLILDRCLDLVLKGWVKLQHCLAGIIMFNRFFEDILEECKVSNTPHIVADYAILRFAKTLDNDSNTSTLAKLAVKICDMVPHDVLHRRPINSILDFRTMETGSVSDSEVVHGVAIPKEHPHYTLPKLVVDARIAAVKGALTLPDHIGSQYKYKVTYSWDAKHNIIHAIVNKTKLLREYVRKLIDIGANVIVVEKGVDESVFGVLQDHSTMLVRGLSPPEFEMVIEATGAKPTSSFHDLEPSDLGYAGSVEFLKLHGKEWVFFRNCSHKSRLTVILKGGSFASNRDFEETLKDAVKFLGVVRETPSFVPGGGVTEIFVTNRLNELAEKISDRGSLVLKAIAEAFENLAAILFENMGLDPVDMVARLKASPTAGEVLDSFIVKHAAIENAIAAAHTILRIDAIIRPREYSEEEIYYLRRIKGLSKENKTKFRRDYGVETLEM
ncbi:MAG: TCP-1/cpn60 chaperonin family protein [Candidatus Caldarchaeum sp.]